MNKEKSGAKRKRRRGRGGGGRKGRDGGAFLEGVRGGRKSEGKHDEASCNTAVNYPNQAKQWSLGKPGQEGEENCTR